MAGIIGYQRSLEIFIIEGGSGLEKSVEFESLASPTYAMFRIDASL